MNTDHLIAHFDRISGAPDAIPRLRQFILDLAVSGKLVEQDDKDEPASELVRRIEAERSRLTKLGQIRKQGLIEPLGTEHPPLSVPAGWTYVRLGNMIELISGQHLQPGEYSDVKRDGVPYITGPADFGKDGLLITRYALVKKAVAYKGQILLTVKGAGIGKTALCDLPEVAISRQLMAMTAIGWNQEFLQLTSHRLARSLKRSARSLIPGIGREDVKDFLFALPPLAEQGRVVAKVEELMSLCDRLEAAKAARENRRNTLVAASLDKLSNVVEPESFRESATFYFKHLPRLTVNAEHVIQLRRTILTLAVQGKLGSQDALDAPASELLDQIQSEKNRLVADGEIRREKNALPGKPAGLGFELKRGWNAATLGQVLIEVQTGPFGSTLHQSDYEIGGVPVINPASIQNERLVPIRGMAVGKHTLQRLASFKLRAGDIIMARRGEMGRCAIVTEKEEGWLCGTGSLILRLPACVYPRFFVTLIGSPFVRKYLGGAAVGSTMQNLNQTILLGLVFGLPPFAEQVRIVAKVDLLMGLCDRLEVNLAAAQAVNQRLLCSLLSQALSDRVENAMNLSEEHLLAF
jgi:type I restriction enzyme S subunit